MTEVATEMEVAVATNDSTSNDIAEMATEESLELPKGPFVSIEWKDVSVTATVLNLGNVQSKCITGKVFPTFEEKLPYRRGIKTVNKSQPVKQLPAEVTLPKQVTGVTMNVANNKSNNAHSLVNGQSLPNNGTKKCNICGRGFQKATYLKRHLQTHGNVKPYKCEICNWGFFQYCNLKRHMISHTINTDSPGFKCQRCQALFSTKAVLSVHLRDAHGEKLNQSVVKNGVKPTDINVASATKTPKLSIPRKLNEEKPNSLEIPSKSIYTCTICHATFDKVGTLNRHFKVHAGVNKG